MMGFYSKVILHKKKICACNAAAANLLQSCLTLCYPIHHSPPVLFPWESPGNDTGVDCHALLQEIFPTQRSNLLLISGNLLIQVTW